MHHQVAGQPMNYNRKSKRVRSCFGRAVLWREMDSCSFRKKPDLIFVQNCTETLRHVPYVRYLGLVKSVTCVFSICRKVSIPSRASRISRNPANLIPKIVIIFMNPKPRCSIQRKPRTDQRKCKYPVSSTPRMKL